MSSSYDGIILFSTSFIIRLLFVFLGSYLDGLSMDSNWSIYYTDIDYSVLTDGSAFMSSFSSPYERSTYRYPPLLALLLIPNGYMPSFGKILFSLFDSMISYEIYVINNIKHKNKGSNNSIKYETASHDSGLYTGIFSWIWVVNVISINICTRGSFDSLNNYLLLLIIRLCYQFRSIPVVDSSIYGSIRHVAVIGLLLGLLIYFRLYPIIYLPAFMVYMMNSSSISSSSSSQLDDNNNNRSNNMRNVAKSSDGSQHVNTTGASVSPTISRRIDFKNSSKYSSSVSDYNTGDDVNVNSNPKKRSIGAVVHSSNPSNNIISKTYRSDSNTHVDQQITVSNDDEGIVRARSSHYFNGIKHSMVLAAFTAMTLLLLVTMSYHIYGKEYLDNAVLYHLDRTDYRHNFSIHFYWTYLKQALTDRHNVFYEMLDVIVAKQYWPFTIDSLPLVARGISSYLYLSSVLFFLPQLLLSIVVIYKVIDIDLSLCLLLLTLIFVAYNKVVTAQYFTWYICLLPTSLTSLPSTSLMKLGQALLYWVLCCLLWLCTAYGLEFNGRNSDAAVDAVAELLSDVYATVWLSSVLFHAVSVLCIVYIVKAIDR